MQVQILGVSGFPYASCAAKINNRDVTIPKYHGMIMPWFTVWYLLYNFECDNICLQKSAVGVYLLKSFTHNLTHNHQWLKGLACIIIIIIICMFSCCVRRLSTSSRAIFATGLLNKAQHRQRLHIVSGLSVTFSPSRFLTRGETKILPQGIFKTGCGICNFTNSHWPFVESDTLYSARFYRVKGWWEFRRWWSL